MANPHSGPVPCHNCRRRRLKCDRSLPQCHKCMKTGQECLGYQRLLRWDQGLASRGKLAGRTFEDLKQNRVEIASTTPQFLSAARTDIRFSSPEPLIEKSLLWSMTDPLLRDLSQASRNYLLYFASDVCKDLVVYDDPKHNPFYSLIPLTKQHEILLHSVIAISALHMSNASQKVLISEKKMFSAEFQESKPYQDALVAKQRALSLLRGVLDNISATDVDIVLAVVLFFTEFELLDSGRDHWRGHLNGARTILNLLGGLDQLARTPMSPLRSCLISNCLVFDVLGSTLARSKRPHPEDYSSNSLSLLLQDAEGNSCVSCPAALLQMMQTGAQLSRSHRSLSDTDSPVNAGEEQTVFLLVQDAQSFDPLAWATSLQPNSPQSDLIYRTYIASAHRAAAQIYLIQVLLSLSSTIESTCDLESLVSEVITHLSLIPLDNPLFKATAWPTFIAGAQAQDPAQQTWVVARLRALWAVEPWGLIRGALGILEGIWSRRNNASLQNGVSTVKWLQDVRDIGVDWLIA